MKDIGLYVAQVWHEVLMNSDNAEYVEKYSILMDCSPVEIQIIFMTGANKELLLRDYSSSLKMPKSTLTSTINRLEKKGYINREISKNDKRSYSLSLSAKGQEFFITYISYQRDIGNKIISGLDEEEKKQLVSLLEKISSYMIVR